MALKSYILNGPHVVILDDDRDPRVSWQHHLNRTGGLRPGVDLVAKVGTPVLAPTPGIMDRRPNDGGAGNSCRFKHDLNPGWADVFSHLASYVGRDYQHFEQGEIIAYTGDSGGVEEHLHRHLLDPAGVRRLPWDYWSSAPAGLNNTALRPTLKESDMAKDILIRNKKTDQIVFANVSARMWVPLNKGYPELLVQYKFVQYAEQIDVEDNEFGYFKSIAERP